MFSLQCVEDDGTLDCYDDFAAADKGKAQVVESHDFFSGDFDYSVVQLKDVDFFAHVFSPKG